jgi:SAM-dependent methyltransferase
MLTIDYDRIGDWSGLRVLDLGCGKGRHSFEALKRGAQVAALDLDHESLQDVGILGAAINEDGNAPAEAALDCLRADATRLPFAAGSFDVVIASEVLEHISQDTGVIEEVARVLRPDGILALSVPRRWPETICWSLSENYHAKNGGHVRIYSANELRRKVKAAGLSELGSHYAHALHSPYWWLKCALNRNGDEQREAEHNGNGHEVNNRSWAERAYHSLLVWDMTHPGSPLQPLERALNPVMGKSFVLYARKEKVSG